MKRILFFLLCIFPLICLSSPTDPDLTFGSDGFNIMTTESSSIINRAIEQRDHKIVGVGTSYSSYSSYVLHNAGFIVRYNNDGSIDEDFGNDGSTTTSYGTSAEFYDVALQSDGKIVAAGYTIDSGQTKILVARYTTNGELDLSFGQNGLIIDSFFSTAPNYGFAIKTQSNDKIIVVGSAGYTGVLARYTADGILDETFGDNGYTLITDTTYNICSLADCLIQTDNAIVALCNYKEFNSDQSAIGLIGLTLDGNRDSSIEQTKITIDGDYPETAINLTQHIQGKFVATGTVNNEIFTIRWNSDGTLNIHNATDVGFGPNGQGYTTLSIPQATILTAASVMIQYDQKIVVCATMTSDTTHPVYIRYTKSGFIDKTFSETGYVIADETTPEFTVKSSFIDFTQKWILVGQDLTNYAIISRCLGNYQELSSPTKSISTPTTKYGTNQNFILGFLPINLYIDGISNPIVKEETLTVLYDIISNYIEKYESIPDFNFVHRLYLLQEDLSEAQRALVQKHQRSALEIIHFFNNLRNRINIETPWWAETLYSVE